MVDQNELNDVPVIVEFVSVPETFDIDCFLSMRESMNKFKNNHMQVTQIKFIAEAVKASPFFVLTKVPHITISSCLFCLELFREIGLTIDIFSDIHESKFRGITFERFMKHDDEDYDVRQVLAIIIVNLFPVLKEGITEKVLEQIVETEEYIEHVEKTKQIVKEYQ
jgi:hypothetical protein